VFQSAHETLSVYFTYSTYVIGAKLKQGSRF